MKTIKTTDVWTEQYKNHFDCTKGAFLDGIEEWCYDSYKVILNCNCTISSPAEIIVGNKHNAIVFYKNNEVVRLLLLCGGTNIEKCIDEALKQEVCGGSLKELLQRMSVKARKVDLKEKPVLNDNNFKKEMDICSCNRRALLKSMLGGSYTESQSSLGNFECNDYDFNRDIEIDYHLQTDEETFDIQHKGLFLNKTKTNAIILQSSSELSLDDVESAL